MKQQRKRTSAKAAVAPQAQPRPVTDEQWQALFDEVHKELVEVEQEVFDIAHHSLVFTEVDNRRWRAAFERLEVLDHRIPTPRPKWAHAQDRVVFDRIDAAMDRLRSIGEEITPAQGQSEKGCTLEWSEFCDGIDCTVEGRDLFVFIDAWCGDYFRGRVSSESITRAMRCALQFQVQRISAALEGRVPKTEDAQLQCRVRGDGLAPRDAVLKGEHFSSDGWTYERATHEDTNAPAGPTQNER